MVSRRQFIEHQRNRCAQSELVYTPRQEEWLKAEPAMLDHLIAMAAENERQERKTRAYLTALRDGTNSTCVVCGETFRATRADATYCSSPCRQKAYRARVRK